MHKNLTKDGVHSRIGFFLFNDTKKQAHDRTTIELLHIIGHSGDSSISDDFVLMA